MWGWFLIVIGFGSELFWPIFAMVALLYVGRIIIRR
jgi:hypothetical protein